LAIAISKTAFVGTASMTTNLSQMFIVTAATSNPAYLVLSALDRNEYTAKATGAVGTLSGSGHTLSLSSIGGDGRAAGIVFTYQAANGRYFSSTYGYLDQLSYIASGSLGDVTNLSLFGTSNLSQATAYASNAYAMMQVDAAGYLGSVTVATQPSFTGMVPVQATPNAIAAVASTFVGQAWNMSGCWVLASTIAAEAGASLPVQSTAIGIPGQANGEWFVAFNGPAGASGNWQSMVHTGEIVVIGTPGGGGHITTCVSGSGASAMLIDNITYVNSRGQITNSANDGSSNDIIVSAPHAASQEWSGVQAGSVVIYELDTPVVSATVASVCLAPLASQSLASLFSATDPANRAVTSWQAYDTAASDSLLLNGVVFVAHSAASAVTAASLASVALKAGATATTDMLEVRAFNGLYWGDWQPLSVAVSAPPPPVAPVLAVQTANQAWIGGRAVSLALPSSTFTDPQHQILRYSATLANGQALPTWLKFNATTELFSGTAPLTAQSLSIKVTATDTSALSTSETFTAVVVGAPTVTAQTPNQSWQEGKPISLALAANTFTDPQGQKLTYAASQSNGQALPGWLTFNATNETFSGTAPTTVQSLTVKVTATDTSGLSASETFATSVSAPPAVKPGITVSASTAPQTWIDGQNVDLVLPGKTFTDALGLKMSFAAYEVSGPNVTSWLHFSTTMDEFTGKVPANASGTAWLAVVASDAQHMSAIDLFPVTFVSGSAHIGATQSLAMAPSVDPSHLAGMLVFHS
jgi:hypothetical protein